jgi:hypothetical protein
MELSVDKYLWNNLAPRYDDALSSILQLGAGSE